MTTTITALALATLAVLTITTAWTIARWQDHRDGLDHRRRDEDVPQAVPDADLPAPKPRGSHYSVDDW